MLAQGGETARGASGRISARLAWCIWLAGVLLLVVSLALGVIHREVERGDSNSPLIAAFFAFEIFASISIGALLADRRPANPIGWLLLGSGFMGALAGAADGYAVQALLAEPGSIPSGEIAAWIAAFVIDSPGLTFGFFVFLFLLFPYGRLPSRGWHRAIWLFLPVLAVLQLLIVLKPGEMGGFPSVENPLGIAALESFGFLEAILFVILLAYVAASAISLIRRFLRSSGEERQQLKWVVAAGAFVALTIASAPVWWMGLIPSKVSEVAWPIQFAIALASIPVACGFAILRYRLYEIDLIINRALVFGALTAFLAGLYAASIQLFKTIFAGVTGETSDTAIVLTTLVLAALFTPAKNRLQKIVDKYFGHAAQPPHINAYIEQLRSVIQVLDKEEGVRRLLEQSLATVNAPGGAVFLHGPEEKNVRVGSYDLSSDAVTRIPIQHDGREAGYLLLAPRADGASYTAATLEPLQTAVNLFGHALALETRPASIAGSDAETATAGKPAAPASRRRPSL